MKEDCKQSLYKSWGKTGQPREIKRKMGNIQKKLQIS